MNMSIAIGVGTREMNLTILPGMDKNSFGYLGNSGGKFWGSEVGTAYGPSFTTNDTIGCGVNLVDRQIFFTKNGKNLGEAFSGSLFDVSSVLGLYPTLGLQTTGEVVEANFGQSRFMYNIEKDINELKKKTASSITEFPIPNEHTEMPAVFQSWVFSYLMHQGYYSTAEALARSTGQKLGEEESSMKSRQSKQTIL
ncbi:ran-binding protein 9-like [Daphnia carinata]|uniref:ran-binding protein 9-like n=1 Tax=Daphnia carinata TaxID=120202 RepID=UPI0028684E8F|nr:ran-binding protein 9-like [Daphnia carinata]